MIKQVKTRRERTIKGRFVKVRAQIRALKLLAVGCILGEKGFSQCRFFINQGGLVYE